MTSACVTFCKCRIQFTPNDQQRPGRDYSDRSLAELRQYDIADYSLRAVDIENNKTEIFAIPLRNEDQYKRGKSGTFPDEVISAAGTYHLWLNAESRTKFHEALFGAIEETKLLNPESSQPPYASPNEASSSNRHVTQDPPRSSDRVDRDPPRSSDRDNRDPPRSNDRDNRDPPRSSIRDNRDPPRSNDRDNRDPPRSSIRDNRDPQRSNDRDNRDPPRSSDRDSPRSSIRDNRDPPRSSGRDDRDSPRSSIRDNRDSPRPSDRVARDDRESIRSTKQSDQNNILADVYQLGQYIRKGKTDDAIELAKKLSTQRVRLEANLQNHVTEGKAIAIRVKIDSNDAKLSDKYDEQIMNVFPSTTIAELRAAFEYSMKFPASNQYFFVNGHLTHEKSTMDDLGVRTNALFVLFVIQQ